MLYGMSCILQLDKRIDASLRKMLFIACVYVLSIFVLTTLHYFMSIGLPGGV